MEARIYQPDLAGERTGLWDRLRRLFCSDPALAQSCNQTDALLVAPDEFDRVQQCLSNPQKPSAAAIRGAEMLRQLPTPSP
jgi:hypothetical protein